MQIEPCLTPELVLEKTQDRMIIGDAVENRHTFPSIGTKYSFESYWSSPEAIGRVIAKMNPVDAWSDSGWQEAGFYGPDSMARVIEMAQQGWKEGAEIIERIQRKILIKYPLKRQPIKFGISGSVPSVPRAVSGDPKSMRADDMGRAKRRKTLTLLSNFGANCGHEPHEFLFRAAVVAAIIDHIENRGYSCDVIGFCQVSEPWTSDPEAGHRFRTTIQVKRSEHPVDINRLAFGAGHVGVFRRFAFAEIGYYLINRKLGKCFGSTMKDIATKEELADKQVFMVPSLERTKIFRTEESAVSEGFDHIVDSLKEQGLPFEDNN